MKIRIIILGGNIGNLTSLGDGSIDVAKYISSDMRHPESTSDLITNRYADFGAMVHISHYKHDSYLLLTPSRVNEESHIVQSVESQLKEHSSFPGWNPRARFVVAVTNTSFSYNAEKLSKRILVELWKRKIVNGIVVIPLTHASKSESSRVSTNRADGSVTDVPSLGIICTWFPYRGPHLCSVVDETVQLDM
jgi:hypothetical protein